MTQRVLVFEELAVRADRLDDVNRQRIGVHDDGLGIALDPLDEFVADGKLDQRSAQTGFHVAQVVYEVAAMLGVDHQGHRGLRGGLLIHNLGIADAGGGEHRFVIEVRHRLRSAFVIGHSMRVSHVPHVHALAAIARDHNRRSLAC